MAGVKKAHPEVEALEFYAMGRLDEPELGEIEEHLLVCRQCQDCLDESVQYVSLMREAINGEMELVSHRSGSAWWRLEWLRIPVPALCGALGVFLVMLAWNAKPASQAEWQTVELQTQRGDAMQATAIEGHSLDIRLEAQGLQTGPATAAIVDAGGALQAELPVTIEDGKANVRCEKVLPAGLYWIRLRIAGETEREYSLTVKKG